MPFYSPDRSTPGGAQMGTALDAFRQGWYGLAVIAGHAAQMSDAEFGEFYGIPSDLAAGAKAEISADVGKLQNGDGGLNGAQITAALVQMMNQFG